MRVVGTDGGLQDVPMIAAMLLLPIVGDWFSILPRVVCLCMVSVLLSDVNTITLINSMK